MIGGVLTSGGLSLAEIVISILIGYGLICVYMIFIGMQACDTGLPVAVMASGALGEKGARYVISTLIAIACIGWFGIQSATCGQAFASMVAPLLGMEASTGFVAVCSIIWGVIMLATACAGFKGLKWLNYIAVPLLVIVCLYGLIAGITKNDGGSVIASYAPETSSGLVFGISMVVASFALGGVISADYCRFAKSRADVVKSSIVGVMPAGLFMLLTGLLWILAPSRFHWLYLLLPFILCGGTYVSMNNSMTHYFLQIVEEERRVAASILIAVVTGAGAGVAGMFLAGGLLALAEKLTDRLQTPDPYRLYFIAATILLLPGLCVLSSMKPLPVEKRMIKKTWFDFLW